MNNLYQEAELYVSQRARETKQLVFDKVDTCVLALRETSALRKHLVYNKRTNCANDNSQKKVVTTEKPKSPEDGGDEKVEVASRSTSKSVDFTVVEPKDQEPVESPHRRPFKRYSDSGIFEYHEIADLDTNRSEILSKDDILLSAQANTNESAKGRLSSVSAWATVAADVVLTKVGVGPLASGFDQALESVSKKKKIEWEEGVNMSTKVAHNDFMDNRKGKIGTVHVRVRCVRNIHGKFKCFFVTEVAHSRFTSPTIFPDADGTLTCKYWFVLLCFEYFFCFRGDWNGFSSS